MGCLFWMPGILCQLSEVVLWNLLSVQLIFWWICGGESDLPVLVLCHLRTAPSICVSNTQTSESANMLYYQVGSESVSRSVVPDSLKPHGLLSARVLCPWNSPGKNTGVCCHSLLQGIFLSQGLSMSLLHWQADSVLSEPPGKPLWWVNSSQISVIRAKNTYSLLLLYVCHCLPVAHLRGFNTVSSLMEKPFFGTLQS